MKKIYLLLCLFVFVLNSQGQLLYEPFSYTSSTTSGLSAQSAGAWSIINTGDSILVDNASLSYTGLSASAGNKVKFDGSGTDYYRQFTSQLSGSVYASFILNVSALGGLTTTGGYFTGFIQDASTTSFGGTVWTRLSTTAGKYNVGISTRSNSAVTWLATDLNPGTPYFIVRAYDMITGTGNDVARIWLNTSAIGGAEPVADATSVAGTDLASVARVFLRQDNTTNTPFIEIDEIRVGTTWASVTPSGAAVPSLSASALTAFGNVCTNTSAGPNSFTITGTALTTANVDVAALTGYTYSATSGGTYTSTLSFTQPGGSFSQQVFVNFLPTAIQSYNGNISVSGGGAASAITVAAVGAGVNSAPSVTTGAASAITSSTATLAGSITATGCTASTAYGIEYSLINGFANGTGTQVASTNLAAGNYTSGLSGLAAATVYYYKAYATNAGGTTYGTQQTFTTASLSPSVNTTPLTSFGNVCVNTTAGPNSFTITGSNLTTANVDVAALSGYTYSTTSGGTYTSSLSLVQPGGTFSQQVFVKFLPTAILSYNGNIAIIGGGLVAAINVAAVGAGVNSAPSITTGAASSITTTTATLAGSISATGCTVVTAYGVEYSVINGFVSGTGTQVASTNLASGNFTSALSGLATGTVYYYKAWATNGGGTAYGTQQTFTTATPPPPALTATALTAFAAVCINTTAGANSFTINGSNLTNVNIAVGALAGYTYDTVATGPYYSALTIPQTGGSFSKIVYVNFRPTLVQSYNGNIPVTGGGTTGILNVAASGSGINSPATVTTGAASNLTTYSATLSGTVATNGCSAVTVYGVEYSGINGFTNGAGTQVVSTNISGTGFYSLLSGLVQGATYYYMAYVINAGGIAYGAQQSFTVPSIVNGFRVYPVPAERGSSIRVSMNNLTPGYYGLLFFNSAGELAYQKNINIQAGFINQDISIPGTLAKGTYRLQLMNFEKTIAAKTILILGY